ncbi:hypothetical protein NX801_16920 [Streptomyces sp. LP05-1]|uniref:Uncharacterized protein n=1 Tax=Streptomyces pyxinae TaxID=2970734 RepID=A0ABT2CIR7_9ACTN|nr:hypothetical protein [Streptomyces sp. LP05-1]MCS0637316.1 hypothetical protein [Streptomyces sp. LP05-1]
MTARRHEDDEDVRERLRAALDARARLVGPEHLRPPAPPYAPVAAGPHLRRAALVLAALAVVGATLLWWDTRHHDLPAAPVPVPTVTRTAPMPASPPASSPSVPAQDIPAPRSP